MFLSDVESKKLQIFFLPKSKFDALLPRINAPTTIQKLMQALPLKGRGIKQDNRLVMPTLLNIRPEKPRNSFLKGDISINPSSGYLSFHLEDGKLDTKENYLGKIIQDFCLSGLSLSIGIIIKELV